MDTVNSFGKNIKKLSNKIRNIQQKFLSLGGVLIKLFQLSFNRIIYNVCTHATPAPYTDVHIDSMSYYKKEDVGEIAH